VTSRRTRAPERFAATRHLRPRHPAPPRPVRRIPRPPRPHELHAAQALALELALSPRVTHAARLHQVLSALPAGRVPHACCCSLGPPSSPPLLWGEAFALPGTITTYKRRPPCSFSCVSFPPPHHCRPCCGARSSAPHRRRLSTLAPSHTPTQPPEPSIASHRPAPRRISSRGGHAASAPPPALAGVLPNLESAFNHP
jgi:hypothetical protein